MQNVEPLDTCFNSIVVRLKVLVVIMLTVCITTRFNSIVVRLKGCGHDDHIRGRIGFNSIVVRLKDLMTYEWKHTDAGFNSIVVRLKATAASILMLS